MVNVIIERVGRNNSIVQRAGCNLSRVQRGGTRRGRYSFVIVSHAFDTVFENREGAFKA